MSGSWDTARISGQGERTRPSYALSEEERNLPFPNFVLPSTSVSALVPHPSRTAPPAPAPASLTAPLSMLASPSPSHVDRSARKRGALPKATTNILKDWLHSHSDHPYPGEDEKKQLCAATGLSMSQVSNWMINARRRILAPVHRPTERSGAAHSDVQMGKLQTKLEERPDSDVDE